MKLRFLGTRGEIEARTPRHRMHSSLEVSYRGGRIMIDAGLDWLDELQAVDPPALLITHAHPDHAAGLKRGAPCPVFATEESWQLMARYPIQQRVRIRPREPFQLQGITFEAFPVEHSLKAPAVGYRVTAGRASVFYAPDLIFIHDRQPALAGVKLYVGDGATLTRSFVRRRGERLIGHAPVQAQLAFCQNEGVRRVIISHCGSEIVTGDGRTIAAKLEAMARARRLQVELAYDGLEVVVR